MSTDDFLAQYAVALQAQANAEARLKLLEMKARLQFTDDSAIASIAKPKPKRKTNQQRFIDQHRDLLEPSDIEFLAVPERDTQEVAEHLAIHRNEVSKRLRAGVYTPGTHDTRGKRMVDTISVIEREVIDGQTDGEQR